MMLQLIRVKFNKETKQEEFAPLHIEKKDIICLYKNNDQVFVVTTQGFMHKVPYKIEMLELSLEIEDGL
jgi:hypothetical protein